MEKRRTLRVLFGILIAAMVLVLGSSLVMAAETERTGWYTTKSKKVYYYDESGNMLKNGRKQIDGKYYYFDKNGVQRTGWQKIGKYYYYFKIANGKKGYMVTSKKVNGITLQKNGRAKITSYSKQKLPILYKANVLMRSITKTSDTKKQKLKKCFEYTKNYMQYRSTGAFYSKNNWDLYYAKRFLYRETGPEAVSATALCLLTWRMRWAIKQAPCPQGDTAGRRLAIMSMIRTGQERIRHTITAV
ncbi:MAG: hypothetical protein LIO99_15160 [Clostridiales bacterium]|nr:hypothetical protein [Clostridiales bacterium]